MNVYEILALKANRKVGLLGKSPSGAYPTLDDLETAYPTGTDKIFVVTDDGNWYYWNDLAWTSGGSFIVIDGGTF